MPFTTNLATIWATDMPTIMEVAYACSSADGKRECVAKQRDPFYFVLILCKEERLHRPIYREPLVLNRLHLLSPRTTRQLYSGFCHSEGLSPRFAENSPLSGLFRAWIFFWRHQRKILYRNHRSL